MKMIPILLGLLFLLNCTNGDGDRNNSPDSTHTKLPDEPFPTDNRYKDSVKRGLGDSNVLGDSSYRR